MEKYSFHRKFDSPVRNLRRPSNKCDYGNCSWTDMGLMELDFENPILNQAADQLGPGFLLR